MLAAAGPVAEHGQALCAGRRTRADDPGTPVPSHPGRPLTVITCAPAGRRTPAVPVWRLLAGIRGQGYSGSMNLLCRYITQGRAEAGRPHLSPKRVARLLLTRPAALSSSQQALLGELTTACPEMTSLARLAGSLPHYSSQSPGTRRGSRTGPRPNGPVTCRPSMPSPAGWSWTRKP